jgi:hypothetical protein
MAIWLDDPCQRLNDLDAKKHDISGKNEAKLGILETFLSDLTSIGISILHENHPRNAPFFLAVWLYIDT